MDFLRLHSFEINPKEAIELQSKLKSRISLKPLKAFPSVVAGVDTSFEKGSSKAYYAIVVLELPSLQEKEVVVGSVEMRFPYIPGLLAFRELPVLLEGFKRLQTVPDVIICDGHGIAHPRRMGLASHLGLWLDLPTIGCAKKILKGTWKMPEKKAGSHSLIELHGEVVGLVLRTKKKCNPVFVSPGHKIDLEDSLRVIQACLHRYKLPEPTRLAHLYANQHRKGEFP
ncbi:MAG: deoxyribonuclease V [Planctomycetota bacterium]|nr:MAG: deoxyribonuclease V [Planctomycetota bacterium]